MNKTMAREMEATIRTNLMQGKILTEEAKPILFSEWARQYLEIETVKSLRSFKDRFQRVKHQLVPFFGGKIITEIKPKDVEEYRAQRVGKNGQPVSLQSVNHDHAALKHCLNIAVRRGLMSSNPASRVPVPNPQNERDRVLSPEEWGQVVSSSEASSTTCASLGIPSRATLQRDHRVDLGSS